MSTLSQFLGGGSVPVGASILALDAPINFTQRGAEYLRQGSVKTYAADYAAAMVSAPQLRVFGNDAKTYGSTTSSLMPRYYYIGTRYISATAGATWQQGTALNSLGTAITGSNATATMRRAAVNGSTHLVWPHSSAGMAPWFTADGVTVTAVGGGFTTFPVVTAACFGNNSWLTLSTLDGSATGSRAFIAAANPSGAWTVDNPAGVGMGAVSAISYGAAVFCAVGTSASATAGKIATAATAGGAWTDRTSASGLTFVAADVVHDIVFSGTNHVIVFGQANVSFKLSTSADGITWVLRDFMFDQGLTHPLSGAISWAGAAGASAPAITTDGAGTVVLTYSPFGNVRPLIAISTDHGVTWAQAQIYIGKAPTTNTTRTASYANGRWIFNFSGNHQSLVDIGTNFATADLVGQQIQTATGQYTRIK